MAAATQPPLSPSSSPRLPSPPPMAEDQLGPKSPTSAFPEAQGGAGGQQNLDKAASRRVRPGTKAADMAEGPPVVELTDIDSAFQLTEHLKALYYSLTHPEGGDTTVPLDKATALRIAEPPEGVDRYIWLYELCRFLCQKVNLILIALFADDPACSSQTCPEMRASEWQYLCAVHDPPKPCCAIDYCCHTLDWAANVLTSPKNFPSRLALGTESNPGNQQRQLTNVFRRVYRIFAHAWFQHREMFWKVEGKTGLYILFKTVCDHYGLIQEENYTVPPEAEGAEETPVTSRAIAPTLLRRESTERVTEPAAEKKNGSLSPSNAGSATAKRHHRASPSSGNIFVSSTIEETEEEEEPAASVASERPQTESTGTAEASSEAKADPSTAAPSSSEETASDDVSAEAATTQQALESEAEAKPTEEERKAEETQADEAQEQSFEDGEATEHGELLVAVDPEEAEASLSAAEPGEKPKEEVEETKEAPMEETKEVSEHEAKETETMVEKQEEGAKESLSEAKEDATSKDKDLEPDTTAVEEKPAAS